MALVNKFSRSSTEVASAPITGALLHCAANSLILPILNAIGALVKTISAPSSTAFKAVIQAIERSSKAPNTIPFLPFNN